MSHIHFFKNFYDIDTKEYAKLEAALKPKTYKKGDNLLVPGQTQRFLYFVKSGIQMSYFDVGLKLHVMAFTYYPGICAVPESFATQTPSKCYLTCLTNSDFYYLSFRTLEMLFNDRINWRDFSER